MSLHFSLMDSGHNLFIVSNQYVNIVLFNKSDYMTKKQKLNLKPIEINTKRANRMKKAIKLTKFPLIKWLYGRVAYPEGLKTQTGAPIPINESLGTYEDQIIPFKVAEYFINKAGTILLIDCPCRRANNCKNHDVHLGCTWMGEGAKHIDISKWPGAHYATKEEALERERLAYENGLVPHFGKLRGDAKVYDVLEYEHRLMSICHCCSCCCIVSVAKYGTSAYKKVIRRMEGVEVTVDPEKCVGCTACFKVCIYNGLEYDQKNKKAIINQDNCMGCGRCASSCPNEAITVSITDYSGIDEFIARYDSRVDISG